MYHMVKTLNKEITLKNVRLSFASALFKAESVNEGDPKFSSTFLLDKTKDRAQIDAIKAAIAAVKTEKWGDAASKVKKICLQDGEPMDEDGVRSPKYDGYAGHLFISASNSKRPSVVDRDKTQLTAEDGKPYSGCYVNAVIRLWAQDNKYGQRVNASLEAVQFFRDGESFGAAPVDIDKAFDSYEDDDAPPPAKNKAKAKAAEAEDDL
jgi:hypothetical protein